jgi:hypothetical protein
MTIKNRKKEPITIEQMKEMFNGVEVQECHGGIALVQGNSNERWWVDITPLVGAVDAKCVPQFPEKAWWVFVSIRERLSNTLNTKVFGLKPTLYLHG